jgi:hypothetical protein
MTTASTGTLMREAMGKKMPERNIIGKLIADDGCGRIENLLKHTPAGR